MDHDQYLTETELRGLLLGLDIKRHDGLADEEELRRWMEEFDDSRDGQISETEFLRGIKKWMKMSQTSFRRRGSEASSSPLTPRWDTEAQVPTSFS